MRILILNWRDIKNPAAGGAEILTHEMAKQWVLRGHTVTQISAGFKSSKRKETIDGVIIIRLGNWWGVHILAFFYYLKNLRESVDVIIDEVHWFPFFSVLYARQKTVLFACEVAQKLFYKVFPYPIAFIGTQLEKIYFQVYRNTPTLAISPSTKDDLIKQGFKKNNITVLPMGLTVPRDLAKLSKEKTPTLIYLSRVNKQKGVEDAIDAFKLIHEKIQNAKLWIIGAGRKRYIESLKKKISCASLAKDVIFFGYVEEKEKFRLLSNAHILIFPSHHEGWGLVIVEAGFVGTPAAVYPVSGAKDVVQRGRRGILARETNPASLAKSIIKVLKDDTLYKDVVSNLKTFQDEVGWEKTAHVALQVLKKI